MTNQDIAKVLYEMSLLYEMDDIPFKPRAYERAALSIESLGEGVCEVYKKGGTAALEKIPGSTQCEDLSLWRSPVLFSAPFCDTTEERPRWCTNTRPEEQVRGNCEFSSGVRRSFHI